MNRIQPQPFWQWAFSDFMSNALRGVLAEHIVASAVGCATATRLEWDAYDLETEGGIKIEVKSAGYLQTWEQAKNSAIRFDIGKKLAWNARTNEYATTAVRSADVYVFCIFAAVDRSVADPLDLSQWFFLMCPTSTLIEKFGNQKTVSLASLERCGLKRISYERLATAFAMAEADIALKLQANHGESSSASDGRSDISGN